MKKDKEVYGVATFHTTHSVLKAEKILKEAGLEDIRLIPVPSRISSDCGVTVRFLLSDLENVRKLLEGLRDDLEGFFTQSDGKWASASTFRVPEI